MRQRSVVWTQYFGEIPTQEVVKAPSRVFDLVVLPRRHGYHNVATAGRRQEETTTVTEVSDKVLKHDFPMVDVFEGVEAGD
jgi:hypothetical protein